MIHIYKNIGNILSELNLSVIENSSFIISYYNEDKNIEGFGTNAKGLEIFGVLFPQGLYWNYVENNFYKFNKKRPLHYGGILFQNNNPLIKRLYAEMSNYKLSKTKRRILKKKGVDISSELVEPPLYNIANEKYIFNYNKVDSLTKIIENMCIYIGGGWLNGYCIIFDKYIMKEKQVLISKLELNSIEYRVIENQL